MNRRAVTILAAFALASIVAGPALADVGASQLRVKGAGLSAVFSNQATDTDLPAGEYFGALLGAGRSIGHGDGAFVIDSLCLNIDETRLHEDGSWSLERSYSACGPVGELKLRGDLGEAHLVALFDATCQEYRGPSWACGLMDIDLTLRGIGPVSSYHDTTVTGDPGSGRSIVQASGSSRAAVYASGHVILGDRAFTDGGAILTDAWLFDLQRGEVTIGR